MTITLDQIKAQLGAKYRKNVWDHAIRVVEIIEAEAATNPRYKATVQYWLDGQGTTTWLRDKVMEPLRELPEIVEIGKKFNPTTTWHNTWMPLDAAAHRARNGIDPEDW